MRTKEANILKDKLACTNLNYVNDNLIESFAANKDKFK